MTKRKNYTYKERKVDGEVRIELIKKLSHRLKYDEFDRGPDSVIGKSNELENICRSEGGKRIGEKTKGSSFCCDSFDISSYTTTYRVRKAEVANTVKQIGRIKTVITYKGKSRPNKLIKRFKELYSILKYEEEEKTYHSIKPVRCRTGLA